MSKDETLRELFDKYKLFYDGNNPDSRDNDVYIHKHYKIITRAGIQKIEEAANIYCEFNPVLPACGKDFFTVHVKARFKNGSSPIYETFASASDLTATNKYYPEMAEKRGRSRAVLTLAGLYELGVFGEDEADAFKDVIEDAKQEQKMGARYKGNA